MSIIYPIGKTTRLAAFKKETTEGTYVAPDQSIHFSSESIKYTPKMVEDNSNIGNVFTTNMIKTGYEDAGSIDCKLHPYFAGDAIYFTLGKEASVANPAQGFLMIWYTGVNTYVRLTKTAAALLAEKSTDGSIWTADTNFGTAGTLDCTGLTLTQIATDITGYTGWKADYCGYSAAPITNWADFTATKLVDAGVNSGAFIGQFLVTSTIAKMHDIYPSNAAADDIPSFSMIVDKNFGTGKAFGHAGCKVTGLTIKEQAKDIISMQMNIVAMSLLESQTYTASAVPGSSIPFLSNLSKVWINNLKVNEYKDLTLTINNNCFKDEAIGLDTFNHQGRQGGTITLAGTANLTVTDASDAVTSGLFDNMVGDTPVEAILYFENHDYADATNHAKYSFLIRIPLLKLTDANVNVSGPDRLTLPINGQAVYSSTYKHIEVYMTNQKLTTY